MTRIIATLTIVLCVIPLAGFQRRVPTVDDLLNLESIGGAQISPDGARVAYTVTETDFTQDAFVTHIWLADAVHGADAAAHARREVRRRVPAGHPTASGSRSRARASAIATRSSPSTPTAARPCSSRSRRRPSRPSTGPPTARASSSPRRSLSPRRRRIARNSSATTRSCGTTTSTSISSTLVVKEALKSPAAGRQRTKGKDFNVGGFSWSPDGRAIAFGATTNPDLVNGSTSDIYVLTLADDRIKKIVSQPGPDQGPQWSPDSRQIVFSTAMGRERSFASNARLAVVPADGRHATLGHRHVRRGPVDRRLDAGGHLISPPFRRRPAICSGSIRRPGADHARVGRRRPDGRRVHRHARRPARRLHGRLADLAAGAVRHATSSRSRRAS